MHLDIVCRYVAFFTETAQSGYSSQKHQTWKRKLKLQAEAFAHYRQTHTANERRRRSEMRGLFDKLKKVLGLLNLPKVSKCYILKQVGILELM